jgi:DNA processing protein
MPSSTPEQAAVVALLRARPDGLSWSELAFRVASAGSARQVLDDLLPPLLVPVPGEPDPLQVAADDLASWRQQGIRVATVLDDDYPERLRGIYQIPPIMFALGDLRAVDRAVSVVGSRKASERGRRIAAGIAADLVGEGITVLSGLAVGIDATAHRAALDAGGRTVAIIGTGIRGHYPAANRLLQDEIADKGLVLSQVWPDSPPRRQAFPMRNAIMSGYGIATVVVEAGEHSGARTQARLAVEHGRPVILTDLVVSQNDWAKQLRTRPGVHVAAGRGEVVSIVQGLIRDQARTEELVRELVRA